MFECVFMKMSAELEVVVISLWRRCAWGLYNVVLVNGRVGSCDVSRITCTCRDLKFDQVYFKFTIQIYL